MKKLLSIVIANYNYGRFLEEAIQSVLAQSRQDVELIVVDGGSTDNSVAIIKKYADQLAYWVSEPDKGQSDAFNKGFAKAEGKYLTWLNADDVLVPGALENVIAAFRKHPECEWFTANSFRFLQDGSVMEVIWGPHVFPAFLQRKNSPVVAFGPSTFFSKNLFDRLGGIDERFHLSMDTELWIRFISNGIRQRRINAFVWGFRMHKDSKTAEFGDHRVDGATKCKFRHEKEMISKKTHYQASAFWHRMIQFWRLLDGSFLHRLYLRLTFHRFDSKWGISA